MRAAGLHREAVVLQADELRLGLHGQRRRVLAPKGVKIVQRLQIEYHWCYLFLGVDPLLGTLTWHWLGRCRQEHLKPVLKDWPPHASVWDGAGAHRGKTLRDLPLARTFLPPYSPELNPAERIFQEIRRRVEGRVYASLDEKQAEVEAYLHDLAADTERVKRLCGWDCLIDAFLALPHHASS